MSMRKIPFTEGEFYHVYNRGTDKRTIFLDDQDFMRFLQSMMEFNVHDPIGSLYQNSFRFKQLSGRVAKLEPGKVKEEERLVDIVAYCLNPNHFHLLLRQVSEKGVEKFMQKLGTGYTQYFNHKYDRTGVLFQGRFKAIHVDSNEYLLHVSAYVNLNFRVHDVLSNPAAKYNGSWEEYMRVICGKKNKNKMCDTHPILGQFQKKQDYVEFAENSLKGVLERRGFLDEVSRLE